MFGVHVYAVPEINTYPEHTPIRHALMTLVYGLAVATGESAPPVAIQQTPGFIIGCAAVGSLGSLSPAHYPVFLPGP